MTPFGWPRQRAQQVLLHEACRTRATARFQLLTAHDRPLISDVAAHLGHHDSRGLFVEPLLTVQLPAARHELRVRVQFVHQRQSFGFITNVTPDNRTGEPQAVLYLRQPVCVYQMQPPVEGLSPPAGARVAVTLTGFLRATPQLTGLLHEVHSSGLVVEFRQPPGLDLRKQEIYWAEFCWPADPRGYGLAVRRFGAEGDSQLIEFVFPGTDDPTQRRRELRRLRRFVESATRDEGRESEIFRKAEQGRN